MLKNKIFLAILLFTPLLLSCGLSKNVNKLSEDNLINCTHKEGQKLYTYGMADNWASYKKLFSTLKTKYNITRYDIDMSSGDVIKRIDSEREDPIVDTVVVGITFALEAKNKGLLGCFDYEEKGDFPDWAIDNDKKCISWYATYYGVISFMVNTEVIKNVPRSWSDLLHPEYKNKIGYLDPTVSATGFATVVAASYVYGGSISNVAPGIDYFKKLHEVGNIHSVYRSQNFIDFLQGRIPILINYDYNLLAQKEKHKIPAELVIPSDGSISYPYVNLVMKKPSHPCATRLFFNFILSREGQEILSAEYVKPTRKKIEVPYNVKINMPPSSAYEKVKYDINWMEASSAQEKIKSTWEKFILK